MRKYVQLYLGGPGGRAVSEEAMRAALDPMERAEYSAFFSNQHTGTGTSWR